MQQELNRKSRNQAKHVRNPPSFELAHWRGFESDKGYDYSYTDLQVIEQHRSQHRVDDKGRKNKEGSSGKGCVLDNGKKK
ncbi:hypothetical protein okayama3_06700 [Yersinia pseudotuberculosis]